MSCIFCRIISGEVSSDVVYQDDEVIAFRDMQPEAPVHILIVPRRHIPSLLDLDENEMTLIGHMVSVATRLARQEGIAQSGFRIFTNCGRGGGQIVPHLHMHLVGGWDIR